MSRLKAAGLFLAWIVAFTALYALETADWPAARNWHMFDWQLWALGAINGLLISSVVSSWKRLREGDS